MTITFGLRTNTHVFICSERILATGIQKIKDDYKHTTNIAGVLACVTGDQGDAFRTASLLEEYTKLLAVRYKEKISPELVARVFSTEIHDSLRRKPLDVQGIVAGVSEDNKLRLFAVDKYGAVHEDDFVATNYGLYFLFGIYDMLYRRDMSEEEAMELIKSCLKVIKERLVLETDKWKVETIGRDGLTVQEIDL